MTDEPLGQDRAEPVAEADPRFYAWRESASRRLSRHLTVDLEADDVDAEERTFQEWVQAAGRALLDMQFRRPATETLLPLAYPLGLVGAVAVPVGLTVLIWQSSLLLGLLFAVFAAVPLALVLAAVVRLMLEFVLNTSLLVRRVDHITDLADDLFQVLSEVAEPVSQLSEDVRAVQFWRFRKRPARK